MRKVWPKKRLGEILKPVSRTESVDPVKAYRLLGVRLDGQGPFLRETVIGQQSSAKYLQRVEAGDFIYSRLFACRGAFGIIGAELNGCYVSGEFPTFVPVSRLIDLRYLLYWFRLPSTLTQVNEDCTGSTPLTRNRFKEQFFQNLEIPLPSIEEQRRLVARIESVFSQIDVINRVRRHEDINLKQLLNSSFYRISNESRRMEMRIVAPIVRRPVEIDLHAEYHELGIRSFGKGTFHKPALKGSDVGTKRLFRIEPGDLLFSNVFAWEGAIAVARENDIGRCGSHRFITCVTNGDMATPNYLCYYFLTDEGLEQIQAASPGGAGRNRTLGLAALEAIQVPVPNIKAQRWLDALQKEVKDLRQMHEEQDQELNVLHSVILDRAFNGEL